MELEGGLPGTNQHSCDDQLRMAWRNSLTTIGLGSIGAIDWVKAGTSAFHRILRPDSLHTSFGDGLKDVFQIGFPVPEFQNLESLARVERARRRRRIPRRNFKLHFGGHLLDVSTQAFRAGFQQQWIVCGLRSRTMTAARSALFEDILDVPVSKIFPRSIMTTPLQISSVLSRCES